jgi:hypothetical protein
VWASISLGRQVLSKKRLERVVEAQDREPALTGDGLDPSVWTAAALAIILASPTRPIPPQVIWASAVSSAQTGEGWMSMQADPPERTVQGTSEAGTRLPAIARYWWLTTLRGLVALTLALAVTIGGRSTTRLVTFLALFWMTGGLITLRFALAIRPRPGFRLGLAAAIAAVVGAGLVLVGERISGVIDRMCSWGCWASPRSSPACCGSSAGSPPRSG